MRREEVEQYNNKRVKVILKGSGNYYHGTIIEIMEDSFIILDKYENEVTIDYELCGLITPLQEKGVGE